MKTLKDTFKGASFYMLGTIERQNWFPLVRNSVPKLNLYMRLHHHIKVVQMNGYICGQHLESDRIHLSGEGYRLFISKALGPLLDGFYARVHQAGTPKPYHEMTRTQKRWFWHNQKNKK